MDSGLKPWRDLRPAEQRELAWWTNRHEEDWGADEDVMPWVRHIAAWLEQVRAVYEELGADDLGGLWLVAGRWSFLAESLFPASDGALPTGENWLERFSRRHRLQVHAWFRRVEAGEKLADSLWWHRHQRGEDATFGVEWTVVARACEHFHYYYSSEWLLDMPRRTYVAPAADSEFPLGFWFFDGKARFEVERQIDKAGYLRRFDPATRWWWRMPVEKSPRILRLLHRGKGRPAKVKPGEVVAHAERLLRAPDAREKYCLSAREAEREGPRYPRRLAEEIGQAFGFSERTARRNLERARWWPEGGFPSCVEADG